MQVAAVKELAERRPFRPFTVRLSNGAKYTFDDPRSIGAPKDYHLIVFFGETESVLIDTDSIVEIMPQ